MFLFEEIAQVTLAISSISCSMYVKHNSCKSISSDMLWFREGSGTGHFLVKWGKNCVFDNKEQSGSRSVTSNMNCCRFRAGGMSARINSLGWLLGTHHKLNLRHNSRASSLFKACSLCKIATAIPLIKTNVAQDSMEVFTLCDCDNLTSSQTAHCKQKQIAVTIAQCEGALRLLPSGTQCS